MKRIGTNINTNDVAVTTVIEVSSTAAVKLLDSTPIDMPWGIVKATNNGDEILYVRLKAAAADNVKSGITVDPGETVTIIDGDRYTGEISGIFDEGVNRDVTMVYF